MKIEKKTNKQLINRFLIIVMLTICESYYISNNFFNYTFKKILLIGCVSILLALILMGIRLLSKKNKLILYSILVVLGSVIIYILRSQIFQFISDSYLSIIGTIYYPETYYTAATIIFIVLILMLRYLIMIVLDNLPSSIIFSLIFMGTIWWHYNSMSLGFAIVYIFFIIITFLSWSFPKLERLQKNKKKFITIIFYILISIIVSVTSVLLALARPKPLQWIDDISLFCDDSSSRSEYIVRVDEQSKLTRLSSKFDYGESIMLFVESPYLVRLKSKTYDIYDKNAWTRSSEMFKFNQYIPDENLNSFKKNLQQHNIPYEPFEISVTLNAQSGVLYLPIYSSLKTPLDRFISSNLFGDVFVDRLLQESTKYDLEAVYVDYTSEEFLSTIKNSSTTLSDEQSYLLIPQKTPERVKELAFVLTKDLESDYDKVKMIENYLSSQYTYTLDPPEKPSNHDYVDYFLFETKQGFCTHYASSMVIMVRSIGIPCRYATGYVLSHSNIYYGNISSDIKSKIPYNEGTLQTFHVQKKQSHAWVEVWFEDFGWLNFEPTSGYLILTTDEELLEFPDIKIEEETVQTKDNKQILKLLSIIVANSLVLFTILQMIKKLVKSKRRSHKQKVSDVWCKIQKVYYKKKNEKVKNETAREFVIRVDVNSDNLKKAVEIFEKVSYSNYSMQATDLKEIEKIYNILKKDVLNKPA